MPLVCSCDWNDDPTYWIWPPDGYTSMPVRLRRARCSSCGELLNSLSTVAKFGRTRGARTDIEARIYGEADHGAIRLASRYLCETCADLYFSLEELGYECIDPSENMRDLVREYAEIRAERRGQDID